MKKKSSVKRIPRSKHVPPNESAEMEQLVAYYLSSVGDSVTMVTQLTFFNVSNYWHITSVVDPEVVSEKFLPEGFQSVLQMPYHRVVQEAPGTNHGLYP